MRFCKGIEFLYRELLFFSSLLAVWLKKSLQLPVISYQFAVKDCQSAMPHACFSTAICQLKYFRPSFQVSGNFWKPFFGNPQGARPGSWRCRISVRQRLRQDRRLNSEERTIF